MSVASKPLRWTIQLAAREFDIDRETVKKRLIAAGMSPGDDSKYSTKQISAAVHGDYDFERTRLAKNQADLIASKLKSFERTVVESDAVLRVWSGVLSDLRAKIRSSPLSDAEKASVLADLKDLPIDAYFTVPDKAAEEDPAEIADAA